MSVGQEILLGFIVAAFVLYMVVLMAVWIATRGWEAAPARTAAEASDKKPNSLREAA